MSLWSLRESIPEAAGKLGKTYKYDLSLPVAEMYKLVEETRERFRSKGMLGEGGDGTVREVVGFGHIGDGNLHLNVIAKEYSERIEEVLEPWVYEWVGESCRSRRRSWS